MAITEVSSEDFDREVVKGSKSKPSVVDFWAPWCGPCHMISPIVEELDGEYGGKIGFFKLNTDESPDIASRYNVMSIPTVMVFKDGEVADIVVGVTSKATLKAKFDEQLSE